MKATVLAFLDVLLIILLLRHEVAPSEAMQAKPVADYLFEIQWNPDRTDDIDIYVKLPTGETAFFRRKDVKGLVVIERDDLGHVNDLSPWNREIVAFRNLLPGEYEISIHNYRQDNNVVKGERVAYELSNTSGNVMAAGRVDMPPGRDGVGVLTFTVKMYNENPRISRWNKGADLLHKGLLR